MEPSNVVPAAAAALALARSREQVVRLIQRAVLTGELRGGRWFVTRSSLERLQQADVIAPTGTQRGSGPSRT